MRDIVTLEPTPKTFKLGSDIAGWVAFLTRIHAAVIGNSLFKSACLGKRTVH